VSDILEEARPLLPDVSRKCFIGSNGLRVGQLRDG
jgi:hypothetical protein